MKNRITLMITICMAAAVLAFVVLWPKSVLPPPSSGAFSPFQTIATRDGAIVATLPATPKWTVKVGTAEPRLTEPGESFAMLPKAVIRFYERHSSYKITAQISPVAGLMIESKFDARSFGGGITQTTPFSPPSGLAQRLFRSLPQKANS